MTHEPECIAAHHDTDGVCFDGVLCELICICEELKTAYQRGYEDGKHNKLSFYYNVHMPECEDKHCGGCIPANPEDLEGI